MDLPTTAELDTIAEAVSNWGRWGPDDERGALNHLRPDHVAAASATVVDGHVVGLSHDLHLHPTAETPLPALHHMTPSGDCLGASGVPGYEATGDWLGTAMHGLGVTHVDALCHMFVKGRMYNDRPATEVISTGALSNTILSLGSGVSGRGVLLDIPAALGVDWLDPSQAVTVADLEAAEERQGLRVGTGDLLLVSTGRDERRAAQGGSLSPFTEGLAGLHPTCLPWLHEREIALLGSDGISDAMPYLEVEEWPFPIHQIGIVFIGLHLIDNVDLGPLSVACRDRGRWAFQLTVAPLRIPGGTGCPVNPVAVF